MDKEKNKTTPIKVKKFLTKTGFILEMEIVEILKKNGYKVKVNQFFLDLEECKNREIDIIAEKKINKINLVLIIECKQSLKDNWVFICSEKKAPRYYANIKHLPIALNLSKNGLFNDTHFFNRTIELVQNYIVLDKYQENKSQSIQIDECLYKLPKALIDVASKTEENSKTIFLPIGIFNNQIFTASFDNELKIDEKKTVKYDVWFESKFYKKKEGLNRLSPSYEKLDYDESLYDFTHIKPSNNTINNIIKISGTMGPRFQIEFVNKEGFGEYLTIVEEGVKKISAKKWTYNTIEKLFHKSSI